MPKIVQRALVLTEDLMTAPALVPRQALGWIKRQRAVEIAQRSGGVARTPPGAS